MQVEQLEISYSQVTNEPSASPNEYVQVIADLQHDVLHLTAQVEQLEISYSQGMMLLPITVEHTIDERSPLWGHSHDSLLVRIYTAAEPDENCSLSRGFRV